jgi:hypothetical protein
MIWIIFRADGSCDQRHPGAKGENAMEVRTYSDRSNARRAARAAGLDPDTAVKPCEDGFEVRFNPEAQADDGLDIPGFLRRQSPAADAVDTRPVIADQPREREIVVRKTAPKPAKPTAATNDKNAKLLKMLSGKGSTVEQLTEALEWLPHTLRARISRLSKPKSKGGEGLRIERSRSDKVTTYRIAA